MFRWEFFFLLAALISSVAGTFLPEGSAMLLVCKAVFGLAFVMFAGALLRSETPGRSGHTAS